jgi:hypothetical protein
MKEKEPPVTGALPYNHRLRWNSLGLPLLTATNPGSRRADVTAKGKCSTAICLQYSN